MTAAHLARCELSIAASELCGAIHALSFAVSGRERNEAQWHVERAREHRDAVFRVYRQAHFAELRGGA